MKAKKGQILVLVLMLMAVGLIFMSPLLDYLNTSYNIYLNKMNNALAYYAVDAMMDNLFSDMYAGKDIYVLNTANVSLYNNASWLNGYSINTSINNSIAVAPPPSGAGGAADYVYMDPGCNVGTNPLNTLASGTTIYPFTLYLTEGTSILVNWYFDGKKLGSCNYYCIGQMWIAYANGSAVPGAGSSTTDLSNGVNKAFQQQLSWTVPTNGSSNYIINFRNHSQRGQPSSCANQSYNMADMFTQPTFSGIGDTACTWVRVGNASATYQDYTITVTAKIHNTNAASITACVRETPGPSQWWYHHSLAVVSWTVQYYK